MLLTGRPISSAATVPLYRVPTVTDRMYAITDGDSPVVYELSRKNTGSSESTPADSYTRSYMQTSSFQISPPGPRP